MYNASHVGSQADHCAVRDGQEDPTTGAPEGDLTERFDRRSCRSHSRDVDSGRPSACLRRHRRRRAAEPALAVLRWARESGIELLATCEGDHQRAAAILERYSQLRLSYVDALLLAIAERHRVEELITVDTRHFSTVRLPHRMSVTQV